MRYKTIKTDFSPRRCELRTRLHFTCSLPGQSFLHELTNYSLTEIMLVQSRRLNQQAQHTNLLDTQHSFISFVSLPVSFLCRHWLSVWYTLTVHRNRKMPRSITWLDDDDDDDDDDNNNFFKKIWSCRVRNYFILEDLINSRTQNFSKVFIKRKSQYQDKILAKSPFAIQISNKTHRVIKKSSQNNNNNNNNNSDPESGSVGNSLDYHWKFCPFPQLKDSFGNFRNLLLRVPKGNWPGNVSLLISLRFYNITTTTIIMMMMFFFF